MKEKFLDLIYATRTLCELLRERSELLEDEELIDTLEEIEEHLDNWVEIGSENIEEEDLIL